MSQDDVHVTPGWDNLITDEYISYVAPHGDVVQLQSLDGFNRVGWFDERFRAIGGPETDYLLRMLQEYPDRLSAHDEHTWQLRHNDVGLAEHWQHQAKTGEIIDTRRTFNVPFAETECFTRWRQKWGANVDELLVECVETGEFDWPRQQGWAEIDWYPSFTRHLVQLSRR
jgi:hypothetical protein